MSKLRRRMIDLVIYTDTTGVRFLLAITALSWALFLIWPSDTFQRPVYSIMAFIAPQEYWAACFAAYGFSALWRVLSEIPRHYCALAINIIGVSLYGGVAMSVWFAMPYPIPAAIAPDLMLALASFWLLMRSGLNSLPGWRND
jgi:hypothetical protein